MDASFRPLGGDVTLEQEFPNPSDYRVESFCFFPTRRFGEIRGPDQLRPGFLGLADLLRRILAI
jgi:hypothetical protein